MKVFTLFQQHTFDDGMTRLTVHHFDRELRSRKDPNKERVTFYLSEIDTTQDNSTGQESAVTTYIHHKVQRLQELMPFGQMCKEYLARTNPVEITIYYAKQKAAATLFGGEDRLAKIHADCKRDMETYDARRAFMVLYERLYFGDPHLTMGTDVTDCVVPDDREFYHLYEDQAVPG